MQLDPQGSCVIERYNTSMFCLFAEHGKKVKLSLLMTHLIMKSGTMGLHLGLSSLWTSGIQI